MHAMCMCEYTYANCSTFWPLILIYIKASNLNQMPFHSFPINYKEENCTWKSNL